MITETVTCKKKIKAKFWDAVLHNGLTRPDISTGLDFQSEEVREMNTLQLGITLLCYLGYLEKPWWLKIQ